jgi:hypothetical protein
MSKEIENEKYLTLQEASENYHWPSGTLYYFRSLGLLESYKFIGDKKTFWKVSELEAVKNRPPEVTKRGPKQNSTAA